MLTDAQREQGTAILAAFGQAIREAGPQGVPSGLLYAAVCDKLSLEGYQKVILLLKRCDLITEKGHVLYWLRQPEEG